MKLRSVQPSTRAGKKLMATFETDTGRTRTTHFGQKTADDYTITHNKEQRTRYRARHKKDLDTNDPTRAGFLSYWLLWGESTSLTANINAYKKKYSL